MKKSNIQNILMLIATAIIAGCGKRLTPDDTAPPSLRPVESQVQPAAVPKNYLAVSDDDRSKAYDEFAYNQHQFPVLHLIDATPGKPLDVNFRLKNDKGDEIFSSTVHSVPTSQFWNVWEGFDPVHSLTNGGTFTWIVEAKGLATFRQKVSVLPASPDELRMLALFEKSGEEAFRVISFDWCGKGEHLFTKVVSTNGLPLAYMQIRNWGLSQSLMPISAADSLNGITYATTVSFSFSLCRVFDVGSNGWGEWQEASPWDPGQLLRKYIKSSLQSIVIGHSFSVIQKDGNWFVFSSRGERYVNGKKLPANGIPCLCPPSSTEVNELIETGHVIVREGDYAQGQDARQNPEGMERDRVETIKMLRGRTLR